MSDGNAIITTQASAGTRRSHRLRRDLVPPHEAAATTNGNPTSDRDAINETNTAEDDDGRQEGEGENDTDQTAEFLGRRVIKSFDTAWYCGTATGFSGDRYQVTYDDGETEHMTRTELAVILHHATGDSTRETAEWQLLRHLYDELHEAVAENTFTPTEENIRKFFSFKRGTTITVAKVQFFS